MTHQNLRLGKCWKLFWVTLIKQTFRNEVDSLENEPVGETDTFSYEWHRTKTRFGTEEKGQLRNCLLAETITPLTSTKTSEKLSAAVWSTKVLMWSYSILRYKVTTYMGPDFNVFISLYPFYPTNFELQSRKRTTGLEIRLCKTHSSQRIFVPLPAFTIQTPLVCKSTELKLYDTFTNSDFILFCFSFLPRTKPNSTYIKTICKLRIVG